MYRMLTGCIVFIYTPDTKEMTSLLEITLPAVTLRRTEDVIFVNKLRENYLVLRLYKWAIIAYIFYQVGCADCYILRVEQFRKTNTSFVIPNSKLSVTVYIYITARQLFSRTTKFTDRYFFEPNLIV